MLKEIEERWKRGIIYATKAVSEDVREQGGEGERGKIEPAKR